MSEWISVKDRLPEPEQEVLLIVHGWKNTHNDIYIGSLHEMPADDGRNNFFGIATNKCEWRVWDWSYYKDPDVTHWMPLPEPPTEGS